MLSRRNFLKTSILIALSSSKALLSNDTNEINAIMASISKLNLTGKPIGDSIIAIGKYFLNTPFLGHSLDQNSVERLTYTFAGFDCLTYCETILTLGRLTRLNDYSIKAFETELTKIRYRDGKLTDYSSRSHYTSEWIKSNERLGIIQDLSKSLNGIKFLNNLNFMSTHPSYYSAIKDSPKMLKKIIENEKRINSEERFYIPKSQLSKIESKIQHGDMLAIATGKAGLDYSHVGFASKESDGRIHLLHASSKGTKVMLDATLEDYLTRNTSSIGISVLRPL